ncbi:MAG: hypothetical protein NUW09_01430 [Deltaproteobacteria bacterium]|nr:hypothetical protein [Deltaproteobacteria bacterium]
MNTKKALLLAIVVLTALTGSRAYAEGRPKVFMVGMDAGSDSWAFELGVKFSSSFVSIGISDRDTGDDLPVYHKSFDYVPLTTWKLRGEYITDESETFFRYGRFLTSAFAVDAGIGYSSQDRFQVYDDPNTGYIWGRTLPGDEGQFTAMAGARYFTSGWLYLLLNYHTRRGAVAGFGIMF